MSRECKHCFCLLYQFLNTKKISACQIFSCNFVLQILILGTLASLKPQVENIHELLLSELIFVDLCLPLKLTFLQFVYLRDNLLSTLDGIEVLKRVKVYIDCLLPNILIYILNT